MLDRDIVILIFPPFSFPSLCDMPAGDQFSLRDVVPLIASGAVGIFRALIGFFGSLKDFATPQFAAGLFWCMFCAWWNSLSQIYVDRMHWAHFKVGKTEPLPDIGFLLIPRLHVAHLPDVWNAILVLGTAIPVLLFHPAKVKILRRFAAIQGTCFLLRSITIMATILPNPYDMCVNTSREDEIPMLEAFKVMLYMRTTCGDVLYSGHAANFTLMALIWQEYGRSFVSGVSGRSKPPSLPLHSLDVSVDDEQPDVDEYSKEWYMGVLLPRIFWLVAVAGYFIIIACRFHYTVDVVVAIVVVAKQWGLYHMVIRTPKLLERVRILQWYESKGIFSVLPDATSDDKWEINSDGTEFNFSPTPQRMQSIVGEPILGSLIGDMKRSSYALE